MSEPAVFPGAERFSSVGTTDVGLLVIHDAADIARVAGEFVARVTSRLVT